MTVDQAVTDILAGLSQRKGVHAFPSSLYLLVQMLSALPPAARELLSKVVVKITFSMASK